MYGRRLRYTNTNDPAATATLAMRGAVISG